MVQSYEVPYAKRVEYGLGPEVTLMITNGFKNYDKDNSGSMDKKEFKELLQSLGLRDVTDEEVNLIMEVVDTSGDDLISWDEFVEMYGKWHKSGKSISQAADKVTAGGVAGTKTMTKTGGHNFISDEEISTMSCFLNSKLEEDEDPEVSKRLPINPDSEDIFFNMADGLLLIKVLNLIDKDAVDMRTINKYGPNMNAHAIIININQALVAAKGHIKLIGVNATNFTDGSKGIILGVLVQMARILQIGAIDLQHCAQIYRLKYEDEEMEDFNKLKPEDILIRWVNHHLAEAGQERRIKNLGKDLADGECMTYVCHQLDKPPSNETEERLGRTSLSPLEEKDDIARNTSMVEQSKLFGVKQVCQGKDLAKGNAKVNTIFVAEVFNTRHGLQITEEEEELIKKFGNDYNDGEGDAEERAFRMWINSLGIEEVFIEKSLYDECSDGINLLRVCDKIKPGCVDWKKVVGSDPEFGVQKKPEKMGPFDTRINCNLAFDACVNVIDNPCHGIGGDNIFEANKKLMLALIWQLARYHALALLGSKEEKDILAWANEKGASECTVKNFGDKAFRNGRFLIKLCESIDERFIDWEIVEPADCDDAGKEANAKYAISLAKKFGAFIFCTWEAVTKSDKKMMLILVAGIYDCYIQKHGSK